MRLIGSGVQQLGSGLLFVQARLEPGDESYGTVPDNQVLVPYVTPERVVYHGFSEGFSLEKMEDHFEVLGSPPKHEPIEARQYEADAKRESKLRTLAWLKRQGHEKTAAWLEAQL
jgi:hypothetical protein